MSRDDDRNYHEARAAAELQLAEAASDPGIAAIHRELAALHKRHLMSVVSTNADVRSVSANGRKPREVAPDRVG